MLTLVGRLGLALRNVAGDRRGVSAIEFAIGAPVFIILMLCGVDTGRYALATRRIQRVGANIGQMVSVNTSGTMSPADLQFYKDATFAVFPQVLSDSAQQGIAWGSDIAITVSSVNFVKVGPATLAMVAWSVGPNKRACLIPLVSVDDSAPPSSTTLPADAFGVGSIIVIDVSFNFKPTVPSDLLSSLPISRTYYVQPRYVTAISYSATGIPGVNQC